MAETKDTRSKLNIGNKVNTDPIQAYLDAKTAQSGIRTNWDTIGNIASSALSGIQLSREETEKEEERKRLELEGYENEFSNNVGTITESAGSLGEEYYGLATEQAKIMQEKYMQAVQDGDKETQSKLKMELNRLSTSVQSLKEGLTVAAEIKNKEQLSNGRTEEEKLIAATCTNPANIVYEEGEWKWKNPKYNPEVEGSKQFFTQDDLTKSLVLREDLVSQEYLKWENLQEKNGKNYINGVKNAVSFNRDRIKTSISDQFITQDNIMSLMHDDTRGSGMSHTFAADVREYLDSNPDFYELMEIDVNGDGEIDEGDWDSDADKKILIDAITNKDSEIMGRDGKMKKLYNYETSKNIVAEYLTMHAENRFYGDKTTVINGKDIPTHTLMVPGVPNSLVTIGKTTGTKGQLMYGTPPTVINTIEELVEAGGNYGYMKELGWNYVWNDNKGKGTWTQIKKDEFNVGGR